jgi:hypothetical protein
MIVIEVKNFERSAKESFSHSEAQKLLGQDIHHYLAFFKDKIVDYDVALSNYVNADDTIFNGMIILRHRVDTGNQDW